MRTGNNLLWVLLLAVSMPAFTQHRYSRVSIQIPPQGLTWLTAKGIDFDHGEVNEEDNTFITSLHTKQLAALKATGTRYTVLIEDEQAAFAMQYRKGNFYRHAGAMMVNGKLHFQQSCASAIESVDVPAAFTEGSYGGYYSFAEMQNKINYMVDNYPNLVDTIILPIRSHGNRPLIVVKISRQCRYRRERTGSTLYRSPSCARRHEHDEPFLLHELPAGALQLRCAHQRPAGRAGIVFPSLRESGRICLQRKQRTRRWRHVEKEQERQWRHQRKRCGHQQELWRRLGREWRQCFYFH